MINQILNKNPSFFNYKIWFWSTALLGLTLIILVPPFHSPDEFNHFYKAYHIADRPKNIFSWV